MNRVGLPLHLRICESLKIKKPDDADQLLKAYSFEKKMLEITLMNQADDTEVKEKLRTIYQSLSERVADCDLKDLALKRID